MELALLQNQDSSLQLKFSLTYSSYPMLRYLLSIIGLWGLISDVEALFPKPYFENITDQFAQNPTESCIVLALCLSPQSQPYLEQLSSQAYLKKIEKRLRQASKCSQTLMSQKEINVWVEHDHKIALQGYELQTTPQGARIITSSYSGYVYALETFSQMFSSQNQYQIGIVKDQPLVEHRGIMIDSSRHFLSTKSIQRVLEAMPLSKLNILHWHLSDDEAFTLQLAKHPQLAEAGKYTAESYYSIEDVKKLIGIAKQNAVTIVPELDTPGHIRSWGLASAWSSKKITILCPKGEGYNHQFDLSINDTYKLAQQVLSQVDDLFKDSPYLHLGGDQVFGSCWDLRPSIKTFMKLKNIQNYGQLQMYWRFELKQALPNGRKVVFWRNNAENVTTGPEDILHYWGNQNQTAEITGKSESKIILSPLDYLYLNMGKGNIWQNATSGRFSTWREIYQNFTVFPPGVETSRILGAEVCLWGEVSNQETLDNNLWMRAASFAHKVWSSDSLPLSEIVTELVKLQKTLKGMGISPSPIVSEFCQVNPEKCFPSSGASPQQS